ncbi:hypothetical protein Pmani_000667 [Petrolisthes manimaculis]|uniref:NACHT domain-containing protein n=1 Tax=Petrolisthes manimaculis TaxID=1843537 RepID=A0AAE1QPK7_9EUCA|nr:hypothetical protein Pmani_000667 [Petrolisthes manimaculis]
MYSSLERSRLESLDKVDKMCQTCIDTLNAAQLRYQEYMTTGQCDQLIQQVLVYVDQIKHRDQSEDVLPPITASQPTYTPGPAITASQPTYTPGPAITANQPTNTPGPAITASQHTRMYGGTQEKVDNDIDNIKDDVLGIDECQKHSLPMLMQMFIPEATHELKEKLKVHNVVTLLDFVKSCDSKEMCLKIQNIFTRVNIVKGKEQVSETHMDYRKLLTWIQAKAKGSATDKEEEEEEEQQEEEEEVEQHEGNEEEQQEEEEDEQHECNGEYTPKPQMLILEGPAGMGKTTLTMLMVNEWLDGVRDTMEESVKGTIECLDYYDLVFKINCRDSYLTSFEDLLKHYMNKTFCKYRKLYPYLTKECRLLIIIDGYDERNSKSRELIEDVLLHLKHSNNSTILCTTRPEHLVDFIQIVPSEYEKNGVELTGIPVDLRAEFMEKYFQEIKRVMGSKESGQELVDKVEREKHKEHYNVPLNLAILAWLFYYQPDKMNDVSSQTELYYHTHQMFKDKLYDSDSLRVFRGHGTVELDRLPASLKALMIAISEDNQARSMLPLLMTQQMHLQHLEVHVTKKVSTEAITNQLPDVTTVFKKPGVSLILSNVKEGEESWVCEVAAKLQPSQG